MRRMEHGNVSERKHAGNPCCNTVSRPATNHIIIVLKTPSSVRASISATSRRRPPASKLRANRRWDACFQCCVCVLAFLTFPYALAHTSQRYLPSILHVHDERNQKQKRHYIHL